MALIVVVVLLLFNAVLVASRSAVLSASRARIEELAAGGDKRARRVARLQGERERLLGAVQGATVFIAALGAALSGFGAAEPIAHRLQDAPPFSTLAPHLALIGAAAVFSGVWLVFAELAPRSLGLRYAMPIALHSSRAILGFLRIAHAPMAVARFGTRVALRIVGLKGEEPRPSRTLDDLREFVREAEQHGLVHGDLVSGAMEFQDREVRQVMTPRTRIEALPKNIDLPEALRRIGESGHSRFPVYDGDLDNVVGVVYARDIYEAVRRGGRVELPRLLFETMVVPWNKPAMALLGEMRKARCHLALVVDEHGSILGLVTLEDLIEVIVGDIHDERDAPDEDVKHVAGGALEADGGASVRDLNVDQSLTLPESDAYVTVAGLVLERLGAIPRGGETVEVPGWKLSVLSMEGHRIARVRIEKLTAAPDTAAELERETSKP